MIDVCVPFLLRRARGSWHAYLYIARGRAWLGIDINNVENGEVSRAVNTI